MEADTIIVGAGLAGLSIAIKIAEKNPYQRVIILCKNKLDVSGTYEAQGGIAVALHPADSTANHANDTLKAGKYLNQLEVVNHVVENAAQKMNELINWGMKFDIDSKGNYSLGLEGGHSMNRIVHHEDSTGKEIHETLVKKALSLENIVLFEHFFATDLQVEINHKGQTICKGITCLIPNVEDSITLSANFIVLATGGVGQVFSSTTNPVVCTGDGIAMALRAGVKIEDMNYIQFHPTALDFPNNPTFLISEAVRGFGAYVVNELGDRFLFDWDERGELATRDIVSLGIATEQLKNKRKVYLDCRHLDSTSFKSKFPKIYTKCKEVGYDPSKQLLPIAPAAHYLCGGIATNIYGETNIENLYAAGECAYTGLHGSNRLASNSLLEALVFSDQICESISSKMEKTGRPSNFDFFWIKPSSLADTSENKFIRELKNLMTSKVGVIKSKNSVLDAQQELDNLFLSFRNLDKNSLKPIEWHKTNNLFLVAQLIIEQTLKTF
ncbi:MAG: L-aspartate oxidase [Flavobacteriales bacterium]|nr:L-aspartate oxidase [Flavobacteriales bacterium]